MYVLVLGLDVLGNTFGLIRGMAEGIEELFYDAPSVFPTVYLSCNSCTLCCQVSLDCPFLIAPPVLSNVY
jgi:hypothetical protein